MSLLPSAFDDTLDEIYAARPKVTLYDKSLLPDVICTKSKMNIFNLLYRPNAQHKIHVNINIQRVSVQVHHLQCAQYARCTTSCQQQAIMYKVTKSVVGSLVNVNYV